MKEISIKKALNANECVRWIEAFITNLGHPLWGSQSMQELTSGMRNICLSSLEMLIPALTASPIKDIQDLQWMPLFISHTHLHLVLSLWRDLHYSRVWKWPKSETNFWKECIIFLPNPPKLSCGFKQISMSMCLHIVLYNVKIYMCLCDCIIDVKCEQNKFPIGQ